MLAAMLGDTANPNICARNKQTKNGDAENR